MVKHSSLPSTPCLYISHVVFPSFEMFATYLCCKSVLNSRELHLLTLFKHPNCQLTTIQLRERKYNFKQIIVEIRDRKAVLAEWLRRQTRNLLGSPRIGSNPVDCVNFLFFPLLYFLLLQNVIRQKQLNFLFSTVTTFRHQ